MGTAHCCCRAQVSGSYLLDVLFHAFEVAGLRQLMLQNELPHMLYGIPRPPNALQEGDALRAHCFPTAFQAAIAMQAGCEPSRMVMHHTQTASPCLIRLQRQCTLTAKAPVDEGRRMQASCPWLIRTMQSAVWAVLKSTCYRVVNNRCQCMHNASCASTYPDNESHMNGTAMEQHNTWISSLVL